MIGEFSGCMLTIISNAKEMLDLQVLISKGQHKNCNHVGEVYKQLVALPEMFL